MENIQKLSKAFCWLCKLALLIAPLLSILFWVQAPQPMSFGTTHTGFQYSGIPAHLPIMYTLGTSQKVIGFFLNLIPMGIFMAILYFLIKLFSNYQNNKIFELSNVRYIRSIGWLMLIDQIVHPFYQAALSAAMTFNNPPGHRFSEVTFASSNLAVILIAVVILLISWVMREGHKLQAEQELTV